MKEKCDVLIPIYNSPEWVSLCFYSLIKNTPKECLGKIYLLNDNSDDLTKNCIYNIYEKYKNEYTMEIITNEKNLGFIKNVNKGMELSTAEYVLLLNTDCLVSKNTIPKLINHAKKNKNIGLICPISSNAANLSLDVFEGYSYMQMNELLENEFKDIVFDACTVVGNCLLITRDCINKVGYLDEIYGLGYGDETDYQFKAHEKGFEAKVAIDTYVFHKSEVSFGTSPDKQKRLETNRKIFFDRWGKQYKEKMKEYEKNDPIEYIKNNIKINYKNTEPHVLFYLPDIHQNAGGVHIVVDIVNYLNINGVFANILTNKIHEDYNEIILFEPIYLKNIKNTKPKCIVGTIYPTIFTCKTIAEYYSIPYVNFMQGYETCFDNGTVYGWAEAACINSQNIITISEFLKNKCLQNFNKESTVISNGINYNLHFNKSKSKNRKKTITFVLRGNIYKGDFILMEILKKIYLTEKDININVIYNNENINFPINENSSINVFMYKGPLPRKKIIDILFQSDIFVDASIMEGFGLMSLEAMAAGNVPILSESFGMDEYAIDGVNSFVIKELNNADKYVEKIHLLLADDKLYQHMMDEAQKKVKEFDIEIKIDKYIDYFKSVQKKKLHLSEIQKKYSEQFYVKEEDIFEQKPIVNLINSNKISFKRKILILFLSLFPKKLKTRVKNKLKVLINS